MAKKQLKKKIQHHSDTFYITRQNPGIVQSWNDSRTQVNRNRRETREAISRASIMIPSSAPEIAIPYNGTPVKDKTTHVSYIGGDRDAARKAYWEEAPIIKAATDSIAGRYGINPELLRSRLNKEGFTDSAINLYNGINTNVDADNRNNIRAKVLGYPYLHSEGEHNIGIQRFGLDDGATYINSGLAHLINESWNNGEFTNEKGRVTNAANGASILDNMGIMASLIKGFRDQAAKDYPNATPEELDNYANIYYNRGITGGRNYINNGNGSTPYTMAEGGSLQTHKPWNNLSMAEKAEMIGVAVRNGITSLPEIRAKYNEFAEGGKVDTRYQHTEPDVNLYAGGGYMEKAKAMIRANEGWRSKPYKDAPKGKNWRSVGYGFNDSGFWERYPEGISKHYENGITKAQAEKELDYFLGKAERQLRGIYGKRWNNFNDDQKAAILDTYYQRPASVGSKSGFYGAVMSGKDGAPYLGVQGFGDRNQSRRDLYRGRGITAPVSFESIAEPVVSEADEVLHFEPLNPQVFGMQPPTYQAPVIDTIDTTDKAATINKTYDPTAIEKQERQDNLRRFGMFMNMLDGASGQDSGMPDFIDMLAGKPITFSRGGHLYDGTTENSQQMRNRKYFATNSRGDSYYVSPSAIGASELSVTTPEVFVTANPDDVARGNAQRWWREHSNVYGEKGLEQVSPEFDLVSLSPLLKPVATKGLKIAAKGLSDAAVEEISSGLSHWNPARRAMEVAMQTSPNHNPLPEIWEGIGSMLRNKEFSRIKDIHNYILRGKPGRTGYNHFNKNASSIYTGLGGSENGYIRSLLYGEHPGGGLRFIGTADNIPVGEHFQTILDRGYKPKDIRVYETDVPYDYSFNPSIGVWDVENSSFVSPVKRYKYLEEAIPFDEKEIEGLIKSYPAEGSFSIGSTGKLYDGQGHRLQYISDPDGGIVGAVRGQDFTDFNYTAYGNRWLPNKNNFLMRLGRKTVDKMTTPIIVRTPWGITEDLQNFLNWHRAFDWKQTGKYVPNDLFYIYALGGRKKV